MEDNNKIKKEQFDPSYLTAEEDRTLVEETNYSSEFDNAKGYIEKLEVIKKEINRIGEELGPDYINEEEYFKERRSK